MLPHGGIVEDFVLIVLVPEQIAQHHPVRLHQLLHGFLASRRWQEHPRVISTRKSNSEAAARHSVRGVRSVRSACIVAAEVPRRRHHLVRKLLGLHWKDDLVQPKVNDTHVLTQDWKQHFFCLLVVGEVHAVQAATCQRKRVWWNRRHPLRVHRRPLDLTHPNQPTQDLLELSHGQTSTVVVHCGEQQDHIRVPELGAISCHVFASERHSRPPPGVNRVRTVLDAPSLRQRDQQHVVTQKPSQDQRGLPKVVGKSIPRLIILSIRGVGAQNCPAPRVELAWDHPGPEIWIPSLQNVFRDESAQLPVAFRARRRLLQQADTQEFGAINLAFTDDLDSALAKPLLEFASMGVDGTKNHKCSNPTQPFPIHDRGQAERITLLGFRSQNFVRLVQDVSAMLCTQIKYFMHGSTVSLLSLPSELQCFVLHGEPVLRDSHDHVAFFHDALAQEKQPSRFIHTQGQVAAANHREHPSAEQPAKLPLPIRRVGSAHRSQNGGTDERRAIG
mmetsp:Transcript_155228/g.497958  ORF Transcript_155228/g.497958 Transcript_155228/m.497958 type:complete len:502 (-) Transcript_155228:694-2199(-)